jgi:Mrp family chromosome partitioning ATPase
MSEECTHNCGTCGSDCSERKQSLIEQLNQYSKVNKKVIGVVSGKGGVGKTFVTTSIACALNEKGYKVGILDADVTGPSVPKMFGIHEKAICDDRGIIPQTTSKGIEVMSANLILDTEETPVLWRGPVMSGVVKQFWTDVIWGELDYLLIDMPPGTGDIPLTVFQSIPMDEIIIVTSPQDLVSMIVGKACNMADIMGVKVLGLVENYSYLECPDCGKKINVFGDSKIGEVAMKHRCKVLDQIPIMPSINSLVNTEAFENTSHSYVNKVVDAIEN